MLIHAQLNVFQRSQAEANLRGIHRSLKSIRQLRSLSGPDRRGQGCFRAGEGLETRRLTDLLVIGVENNREA
jgi:hypothetical protein